MTAPWVLIDTETGRYVARPGSEHSYTRRLEEAQTFMTRDVAVSNACGNERPENVHNILTPGAGGTS